jgi:hypothetical protein
MEVCVQQSPDNTNDIILKNLTEELTIYELKLLVKQAAGYATDQQMMKYDASLLSDSKLVRTIPSDDSQRAPELTLKQMHKKHKI